MGKGIQGCNGPLPPPEESSSAGPSRRSGPFYHVAPTALREQILREGLRPWQEGQEATFMHYDPKPCLYLWSSVDHAYEWADSFADHYPDDPRGNADIWEVAATDLEVEDDPRAADGLTTAHTIHAQQIKLLDTLSIDDMSKWQS